MGNYFLALVVFFFSACSNFKSTSENDLTTHHQALKDFAGTWAYQAKFWATPKAEPQLFEGVNVMEMIYGGKFLKYQSKSKSGSEGTGYIGYDNLKQKYETFWIDNMSTGMMHGVAQFNYKTRTLEGIGEYSDPSQKSKIQKFHDEWKIISNDQLIYTQFIVTDQHPRFKQIEIQYQRKK